MTNYRNSQIQLFSILCISFLLCTHARVIGNFIDDQISIDGTVKPCSSSGSSSSNSTPVKRVSFSELLQESILDIENLVQAIFENLTLSLSDNSFNWLSTLKGRLIVALQTFENKILGIGDNFLRELFGTALAELKHEFQLLAIYLDEQLETSLAQLNETIINNSDTIDIWTAKLKDELRSVNNTHLYNVSCSLLNDFVDYSSTQLRSCCNIIIRPGSSLCGRLRGILNEVVRYLVDVVDRIQICLEDKKTYESWEKSCIKRAFNYSSTALAQLNRLWNDFKTLVTSRLLFNTSLSSCCFSMILVQVQHRQKEVNHNKDGKLAA